MKNVIKKVALAGAATMLLSGVAFANVGYNRHDDHHKDDYPKLTETSMVAVEAINNYVVSNRVSVDANTGFNGAPVMKDDHHDKRHDHDEQAPTTIDTGGAGMTVSVMNEGNKITVNASSPEGCNPCNTESKVDAKITSAVAVKAINNALVNNCVDLNANTGFNSAGDVTTGDATISLSLTNDLNSTSISVNQ